MRKTRKQKSRRGGATNGFIYYKVSGMTDRDRPLRFKPSMISKMDELKQIFILDVNGYKDAELELFENKQDEENAMEHLEEPVAIRLIRGGVTTTVYQGKMDDWDNDQMKEFISSLNDGDSLFIELQTQA
jgi:hypothetical protein